MAGSLPSRQVRLQDGPDRGGCPAGVTAVAGGPAGQPVGDEPFLLIGVALGGLVGQAGPQDAADVFGVVQADAEGCDRLRRLVPGGQQSRPARRGLWGSGAAGNPGCRSPGPACGRRSRCRGTPPRPRSAAAPPAGSQDGPGDRLGGHHRLHYRAGLLRLGKLAGMVFGRGAVQPALDEICATLLAWKASEHAMTWQVTNAAVDLLLSSGSPRLADITEDVLHTVVAGYPPGAPFPSAGPVQDLPGARPQGHHRGPADRQPAQPGTEAGTLSTVPAEWLEWAQRWRTLSTHEPGTIRTMFSTILIAGRWAGEKHPEAITPDAWTRDIAAEYIAGTLHAVVGQWAGHNRNHARWGSR